jgi:hypothetical protein
MDLLSKFTKDKIYSDRINPSSYVQGINIDTKPTFPSIIDLFFSVYDHHYILVENKDKQLYVKQRLMNIATEIDEDKSHKYDNFNYLKCMNPTLIQQGLQAMNTVSALLYLSDYYGVTTHVYLQTPMLKVVTSEKNRTEFNIVYTSGCKWSEIDVVIDVVTDYKDGSFEDLGLGLTLDVKTRDIYKKYLNPIGKYKSPELIEIAKEMNLPLDKGGKKKVKKELYDDINLYQLNLK